MTDEELSTLAGYQWMPSRIPLRDALTTLAAEGLTPEPIMEEMSKRCGQSVWYIGEGEQRVMFLYDGGKYDASRFKLEPKAWDHEHCSICSAHIPAMTVCYVTKYGQPYYSLCVSCYESHVAAKKKIMTI